MAIHKLNAANIKNKPAGKYEDGAGLRLVVSKTSSRSWVLRYTLYGKRREMGLGSLNNVSLADARKEAEKYRALASKGDDPKHARDKENTAPPTFAECASNLIESKRSGWKNLKHAQQWENTLATHVNIKIGPKPINKITPEDVIDCLKPIWYSTTETASRIRGRMEKVIDYGTALGYREGPNPARWNGHLEHLLPNPNDIATSAHHPAMPIDQISSFYTDIKSIDAVSALALRFLILTATRTSETLNAEWNEITGDVWVIPAERMKGGIEHRVPLTSEAIQILNILKPLSNEFVFNGSSGKPLSNMAMLQLMRREGYGTDGKKGKAVPHGFRSTFRDWCSEQANNYPPDAFERALAHKIANKTEAAYHRTDMLDIRRKLMTDWCSFLIR